MARQQPLPSIPLPPEKYSRNYLRQLVQSLVLHMQTTQTPGEGRHTDMVFTDLPHHDKGLEVGGLFQHVGSVKISQAHNPHLSGVAASGAVGTITVSTS